MLNEDHEIVWLNPEAGRLLGVDPKTAIGQAIDSLLSYPEFVQYLAAPRVDGIVVRSPAMESGWLAVQIIPYGPDQRVAIIRDVTREMRLERTRRDFVANVSHELRSPLTVVSGYLDTMADDNALPENWQTPIAEMMRQANRMTQILRDLIELARLESADGQASNDFVDVPAMLTAIVKEFDGPGDRPELLLQISTDAALLGNESELHSIFYNLISNAMRFTPSTGQVAVRWRSDDGAALFEVVDSGIGIPADKISRVTERFYRVDPSRSRATGGTGLGLAIVKHSLQRHDSTLSISSTEGQGSTFKCRFAQARIVSGDGSTGAVI